MTAEGSQLALELYDLLRDLDRSRFRVEFEATVRAKLGRVQERVAALLHDLDGRPTALAVSINKVRGVLDEHPPRPGLTGADLRAAWMRFRGRMVPAYLALAQVLRAQQVHVPPLRPTNYTRTVFHVLSAFSVLLLLEVVLDRTGTVLASGAFAAMCWFLETGRAASERFNDRLMQVRFFQRIIHPHEHRQVNSATWYATALLILSLASPVFASAAALAVLGAGDQVAAAVGRRWGRTMLLHGRTLEGTAAFVVAATAAAFAVLLVCHPIGRWPILLALAAAAALSGAVAEVASKRLDDNFTIPLAAAAGAATLAGALGL